MTTGKRVRGQSLPPPRQRGETGGRMQGKRQQPPQKGGSTRRTCQLLVSAAVLLIVVTVKFTMPEVTQRYGGELLRLIGCDTDFAAVFSAAGRAVGGDDLSAAVNDAYVAVFGAGETHAAPVTDRSVVIYGTGTTPEIVNMLQQVLGFAYQKPVEGEITSSFGFREHPVAETERFHYGIDLACGEGTVIHAFADGTVTAVAESSELGKYVELTHTDGYTTLYAHCSRVNASSGQTVRMGDPIAEVGDTGDATGYHLHFELHQNNIYLNPIYYVS